MTAFIEIAPFLFSTLTSLGIIYYKFPLLRIQQTVALLLVVILLFLTKLSKFKSNIFAIEGYKFVIVYILSLFIQLLVIATGGFFSPLLIVIHIFTLAVSFLLNLKSSVSFLFFSLIVLIFNTQFNSNMFQLFREDPASVILYITSFLIIIPLAQTITRTYRIKDNLSKKLGSYLQLSESKSESILMGLNDVVLITDSKLNIISANEAIQKMLKKSEEELIRKPLLDVVKFQDLNGKDATFETLQIENILKDKYARIIEGFSFKVEGQSTPNKVTIQIRPIVGQSGNIDQIVFVITSGHSIGFYKTHPDLEEAKARQKALFNQIKNTLIKNSLLDDVLKFELFNKTEQDILIVQELEDHPLKATNAFEDVAFLCKQLIFSKAELLRSLKANIQFNIIDDAELESSYLKLRESNSELISQSDSSYTCLIDKKWFTILLEKLIDIFILIGSGEPSKEIILSLKHQSDNSIGIIIASGSSDVILDNKDDLLDEYYGKLNMVSQMALGSGFEGFIAKKVANQLNISIEVRAEKDNRRIVFSLSVKKNPNLAV